jgi:RNA polymerase sigma-70 factor (ECF subfamily)
VVALNRALAIAQRDGVAAGRRALDALSSDARLATYSFHWAARADLARRAGDLAESRASYARAIALATSRAERDSYARRVRALG